MTAVIELDDFDLASPEGAAVLRSMSLAHGAAMAAAATSLDRLFTIQSPWAPGLRFVGGQASSGHVAVSLAGGGETLEEAFASCVGEAVERVSQVARPADTLQLPIAVAVLSTFPTLRSLIEAQCREIGCSHAASVAWMLARTPASTSPVLVPADWCLRSDAIGPLRDSHAALSTGTAAGPTYEAAALRALLELVERDAASLWWIGGQRGRPLALDQPAMAEAVRVAGVLRSGCTTRTSWLLDITSDVGVPTIAALSVSANGRGLACGLAARLTLSGAVRAALLELCQMELGLLIAMAKHHDHADAGLTEVDRRHLTRASQLDAETCAVLHASGRPARYADPPVVAASEHLDGLIATLAGAGHEVALVDLTRREFELPVVKAIVPSLQLLPSSRRTSRLTRTIELTGGGDRWTEAVSLV